jgi:hypothetical protein
MRNTVPTSTILSNNLKITSYKEVKEHSHREKDKVFTARTEVPFRDLVL